MKRILSALVLTLMVTAMLPGIAGAEPDVTPRILLDGYPLAFPVAPVIIEGRTMVPFRAIAEALGVKVEWDQESSSVQARGLGHTLRLTIGQKSMLVDDVPAQLDVAPMIVNSRTLIPLRAFTTAFGARVGWIQESRTVTVQSPVRSMRTMAFYALRSYADRDLVPRFSDVAYGWATLTADDKVDLEHGEYRWPVPDGDVTGERLLDEAARASTRRHLMIQARDGKGDLTALVLNDRRIDMAAAEVAAVVQAKGFDGVVLDMEGLGLTERGEELQRIRRGFTRFVAAVAARLRPAGRETIVSVHPLNGAYHGYDYAALALEADLLQVMAHDYTQDGNPEPSEMVDEAIQLALEQLGTDRSEKLMLGIVTAYENPETLPVKVGLAKRYNLAGISVWRLGAISAEEVTALAASVSPRK